ncbi:PREDICTED: uncharacterized protein LOC104820695 [Tarenaya hassleriana]|uniref:uncharacterized protein LOC104820695 n=1 Tax=Tarenaya hassleriana TaxID=28532 RepID=UPI00053C3D42|nr:PREDICTED: uncharacterized protein LOC104820695 [Tarenaya hassleriana]
MESGEGGGWFDALLEEIGLAIEMADDAIQKKFKALVDNVREIWWDLVTEMFKTPNLERPETEETSRVSDSKFQVEMENLEHEASESDVDDDNAEMKYISDWFRHHKPEDCKLFLVIVASDLRAKGRLDLAAEVEKLLVRHFHIDESPEAFDNYGSCHSNSVEDNEQTEREQARRLSGNHSEESVKRDEEEEGIKEMKKRLISVFLGEDTKLFSDEDMGMLELDDSSDSDTFGSEQEEPSDYGTCMSEQESTHEDTDSDFFIDCDNEEEEEEEAAAVAGEEEDTESEWVLV